MCLLKAFLRAIEDLRDIKSKKKKKNKQIALRSENNDKNVLSLSDRDLAWGGWTPTRLFLYICD